MISGGGVTIGVSSMKRALRFYIETLGMKLVRETSAQVQIIDAGEGFELALTLGGSINTSAPIQLRARDLANAITIYENRGIAFSAKTDRQAIFSDSEGNRFQLIASN
jgi:catechol 2,3-dioxygenase-like lactoylglutathione lyase family enzyme